MSEFNGGGGHRLEPLKRQNTGECINICYSSDKNYAKLLALSMASVLATKAQDDKICFYILDGGLTDSDKEKILNLKSIADCQIFFTKVQADKFKDCPVRKGDHISKAAYYRLSIPTFFPNVDKIIYLDCDIEVRKSLKDLFCMNIEGYPFGAVDDIGVSKNALRLNLSEYFNSGMLLLNLKYLRDVKFCEKVFDWITVHIDELKFHDQDVLNLYFATKICKLDEKWNFQVRVRDVEYPKALETASVIHYIGRKKNDFVFGACRYILKTKYKRELGFMCTSRIFKFVSQWLLDIRNIDDSYKKFTIIGLTFNLKRKNKNYC